MLLVHNINHKVMGKGDLKSRRGKLVNGSYGVRRRSKKNQPAVMPAVKSITEKAVKAPVAPKPKAAPRKKKEE